MIRQSLHIYTLPIRFAPLRSAAYLASLERRLAQSTPQQPEPWDPWPPARIGYGPPSSDRHQSVFLPTQEQMRRLENYIKSQTTGK